MKSKGFTLIELLVVISIVSLLSSIILAALSNARSQASFTAGLDFADHNYQTSGADAYAYYDFNTGIGTNIPDTSNNNRVLTPNSGSFTFSASTPTQTGKSFVSSNTVGSNVYGVTSTLSPAITGSNYTLSAWINLQNASCSKPYCFIAQVGQNPSTAQYAVTIYWNGTNLSCYSDALGSYILSFNAPINLNTWTHVACSVAYTSGSNATMTTYINGKQTNIGTNTYTATSMKVDHISVGGDFANSSLGPGIGGLIDDVAFYSHSITGN